MLKVEIFTDGACRGNPGPGGWGVVFCYPSAETVLYGAETLTTNNRMELMAPIMALNALTEPYEVILTTDSQYVQKGITEWLFNWKKRGFRTANKQPVKNSDLWKKLDEAGQRHSIEWRWVRGHSGHRYNEKADQLANQAINKWLAEKSLVGR